MKLKIVPLFLLLNFLLTACVSIDPVQGAMDPTIAPSEAIAAQSTLTATAQPLSATNLNTVPDAWMVVILEGENNLLRAISATGKSMVELGPTGGSLRFAGSPDSAQPWFSLFTGDDNGLTLFDISKGSSELIPLLKSGQLTAEQKNILQAEFLRTDLPAQVWSPDGTRLAYLDVSDGQRSRLMVFDTSSKTSAPISQATENVIAPVWSPDGQWLLYQTIDGFVSQGLPQVLSVHAVRANRSEDRLLYTPASLRETVLGWDGPETFVVQSLIERGNRDLRLVSVKDGSSYSLNAGLIKSAGWDAKSRTAMYLLTASETNNEQPSGVYAVTPDSPQRMVLPGDWEFLQYFPSSGIWAASSQDGAEIIPPDGSTLSLKGIQTVQSISTDGQWLAGSNENSGLVLAPADGTKVFPLADSPVQAVFFSPDSQKIYYSIENTVFLASLPDWKPQLVPEASTLLGWVGF